MTNEAKGDCVICGALDGEPHRTQYSVAAAHGHPNELKPEDCYWCQVAGPSPTRPDQALAKGDGGTPPNVRR